MGLVNVPLGTALVKDPGKSLLDYIKNNWVITDPPVADINFNHSFGNPDEIYHVIVENMPQSITPSVLGSTRYKIKENKRIQLRYSGTDYDIGKDKLWKMKERIEDLINSNVRALLSDGISSMSLSDYDDKARDFVNASVDGLPQHTGIMGGEFLISLKFDKVVI